MRLQYSKISTAIARAFYHPILAWVFGIASVVLVWHLTSVAMAPTDMREPVLPGPSPVGQLVAAQPLVFFRLTLQTGLQALIGLFFAAVGSCILITFVGVFRKTEPVAYPYLVMLKASPAVAYVPLFMVFVGTGPACKILVAAMISFFPMVVGGLDGLHATPSRLQLVAEGYGASRWRRFSGLYIGYALAGFLSGLKTSAPLAVVGSIVGEYVAGGRPTGLGSYIMRNTASDLMVSVFAGVLMATILGLMFFGCAYILWYFGNRRLHLAR